nr:hypothetical protein [Tanacetum cinerariifolium]
FFACFLSQLEPSSVAKALEDLDWVAAMQEEMQQFYNQQVWKLVPLPDGKFTIRTKWILNNKKDVRGIVMTSSLVPRIKPSVMSLSQDKYVKDMLKKFDMESVRTAATPYEVPKPKSKDEPDDAVNVHLYRSMIGSLMYLTAFRPDIMFAVSAYSRHQVTPMTSHLNAVKKIFKYLKGQPNLSSWHPRDSPFQLEAYSDSDYVGSHGDRKSTTGGWPPMLLVVPVFLLMVLVLADGWVSAGSCTIPTGSYTIPTGSCTISTGSCTIPTGSCTIPTGSYSFMLLDWFLMVVMLFLLVIFGSCC